MAPLLIESPSESYSLAGGVTQIIVLVGWQSNTNNRTRPKVLSDYSYNSKVIHIAKVTFSIILIQFWDLLHKQTIYSTPMQVNKCSHDVIIVHACDYDGTIC